MRTREMIIDTHVCDPEKPSIVAVHELSFPDDFIEDVDPSLPTEGSSFATPDCHAQSLERIRKRQLITPYLEFAEERVACEGKFYTINTLQGTEWGLGIKILPKKLYDGHCMLLSEMKPITHTDFYHNHTTVPNVEPLVSNLFSAGDILSMSRDKTKRYWTIGIDSTAYCLVNPTESVYRDMFDKAAHVYGGKFHKGYTFEEAYQDLLKCVKSCGLQLYHSLDLKTFTLVS